MAHISSRSQPKIFLSYRREDTGGHAGWLYDALGARFGAGEVFKDVDTIDLGADFAEAIEGAVRSCDVLVVLIGRIWLTAADAGGRRRLDDPHDFVRIEIETALAAEIPVVPTTVQGASIPSAAELPPSLAPLAQRQGIELRDAAWRDDVERLARRLAPPEAVEPARRVSRRRLAVLASALAAVVAIVVAVLATRVGGGSKPADPAVLAVIDPAIRPSCQSVDYGPESAVATVSCSGTKSSASYSRFADNTVMGSWYALMRDEAGVGAGSGTCTATSFHGDSPYSVGGHVVGNYFCYVDRGDGSPNLVATDDRSHVALEAQRYSGTGPAAEASLYRQWRTYLRTIAPQ